MRTMTKTMTVIKTMTKTKTKTRFFSSLMGLLVLWGTSAYSQPTLEQKVTEPIVQNGPMVGYSEMLEVALWIQTTRSADVYFTYRESDRPDTLWRTTNKVKTLKEHAFTATLICDQVLPGRRYDYQLWVDGKWVPLELPMHFQTQSLWQYQTQPPAFQFATGSCTYINEERFDRPGNGYGGNYKIFEQIGNREPDFMLWLGDNIYLREGDWNTRTGIQHRYTHGRGVPEMRKLLAKTHHYAIWDDHDYGPNNSDGSFTKKDLTLQGFMDFWANPSYGTATTPGIFTQFQWADCDFIALDNRYHRSANGRLDLGGARTILGEDQLNWFLENLLYSKGSFKFVPLGGQFVNSAEVFENYANLAPEERQKIIDFIYLHDIKNVVFLTGDRHHGSMSKIEKNGEPTIYEITVSPLTSGPHKPKNEYENGELVKGTMLSERHFAIIEVSGDFGKRKLTVRAYNTEGKELWNKSISQEE